jgi:hypothetical protein
LSLRINSKQVIAQRVESRVPVSSAKISKIPIRLLLEILLDEPLVSVRDREDEPRIIVGVR